MIIRMSGGVPTLVATSAPCTKTLAFPMSIAGVGTHSALSAEMNHTDQVIATRPEHGR